MTASIPPVTTHPPAADTLAWVAEALGIRATLRAEALSGGSASDVWRLQWSSDDDGGTAVLKQATVDTPDPDSGLIAREFQVLDALRPLGLPVPVPLACDPVGARCGRPALLMSLLPGQLLQGPAALRRAIAPMADALAGFQHRCNGLVAGRRYRPWHDPRGAAPSWSSREALWLRAQRVATRFPAPLPNSFVHRDPHPANLLFVYNASAGASSGAGAGDSTETCGGAGANGDDRLTVSGILDWPHAGRGPSGIDGSRMALNLACLLDLDAALEFRARFEDTRGLRQDPLLDVLATLEFGPDAGGAATWAALGVTLTRDQIRERIERFLEDAMLRMTTRRVT